LQFLSNEKIENLVSRSLKNIFDQKPLPLYDMMSYHYGFHEDTLANQIRPHQGTLLLVGVDSFGGEVDSALPAALAIELINGFCQVHDDVESGRPSSQGRDSLWWVWGPAQAINAGDGLHALARITVLGLIDKGVSLEKTYRAVSLLDEACLKACEGRFRDLEIQERPEVSIEAYQKMASDRSGAILGGALSIAGLLSGFDEQKVQRLVQCGEWLGEYFQIQGDLNQIWEVDTTDNVEFLNKKKLYPVVAAMSKAGPSEKRKLGEVYFKRVLEPEDLATVREVIEKLGGREDSIERLKGLREKYTSRIYDLSSDENQALRLVNFIDEIEKAK
jgi:geranylgeranyl diphosphate synthase type I